jgi:hypothetical protein
MLLTHVGRFINKNRMPGEWGMDISVGHRKIIYLIVIFLCVSVLVAYSGFIGLGHWQDEYVSLKDNGSRNASVFIERLLHWSPRPFSEGLIFIYFLLSTKFRQPLIGLALSLPWAALFVGLFGIFLLRYKKIGIDGLVLMLCCGCLFLLAHPVGEMFYWPMAALAYISTLSCFALLFNILLFVGMSRSRVRIMCAVVLVVAAWSTEMGAIFVLVFSVTTLTYQFLFRHTGRIALRHIAWLLFPVGACFLVLLSLRFGRFGNSGEVMGNPAVAHHFFISIRWSVSTFVRELVSIDGSGNAIKALILGVISKGMFCLAAYGLTKRAVSTLQVGEARQDWLAILSIACLVTSFLTIVAAFYQFGMNCCERHGTFRQCLIFIALAAGAASLAMRGRTAPIAKKDMSIAPIYCALIAVLLPLAMSFPAIVSDYKNYHAIRGDREENWAAGIAAGDSMTVINRPNGRIVGGFQVPSDTCASPGECFWREAYADFFKKKVIVVNRP